MKPQGLTLKDSKGLTVAAYIQIVEARFCSVKAGIEQIARNQGRSYKNCGCQKNSSFCFGLFSFPYRQSLFPAAFYQSDLAFLLIRLSSIRIMGLAKNTDE